MRVLLLASLISSLPTVVMSDDAAAAKERHPLAVTVGEQLENPNESFGMWVTFELKADAAPEFLKAFDPAVRATRKETGNLAYNLHRSAESETTYRLYEGWKTLDALDSHLKQPYLTKLLADLSDLLSEPPAVEVLLPVK